MNTAVAQVAGDSVGQEIVGRGRSGALGQHGPVKIAILGGHRRHLSVDVGNQAHIGVTGGEVGHRVVRGGEEHPFNRAFLFAGIHQHRGKIIGTVRGQAGNAAVGLSFRGGEPGVAGFGDGGAPGGRFNQGFGVVNVAVCFRGDGPVNRALFVAGKDGVN